MTIKIPRIISAFPSKKIGVIGDIMLDHYIDGSVERISAEAPVPIISAKSEQFVPGGAANTALNSAALGAKTELVGVVGRDLAAKKILEILGKNEVVCRGVFTDSSRRSTEKTRITASGQQLVRIDREDARPIKKLLERRILNYISAKISGWDAIVVSDYAKGVITLNLAIKISELAHKYKKPLIVDAKPVNFEFFKKATIMSPNKKEAGEVSGINPESDKDIRRIGEALRKK
ncbi:MAG: PfkB family carbohydrate kinase, partial [Patescibacteria group bacterium]